MEKKDFKNPDAAATKRQTWAIFCMAKEDVRDIGLTRWEASEIISALKNGEDLVLPERLRKAPDYDKVIKPFTVGAVVKHKEERTEKKKKDFRAIFFEALKAGSKEMEKCRPIPMVVEQHENMLNDNSPVKQSWVVPGGPCGFASVHVKCKGKAAKFINYLKKKGLASADINDFSSQWRKDDYRGGYYYWVSDGGQSLAYKEAFARGMVETLQAYGIDCYMSSRMD